MKRLSLILLCMITLLVLPVTTFAATASNYDDLSRIYDNHMDLTSGYIDINGTDISWDSIHGEVAYYIGDELIGTTAEGDKEAVIRLIAVRWCCPVQCWWCREWR